jgi:hypothetical protein
VAWPLQLALALFVNSLPVNPSDAVHALVVASVVGRTHEFVADPAEWTALAGLSMGQLHELQRLAERDPAISAVLRHHREERSVDDTRACSLHSTIELGGLVRLPGTRRPWLRWQIVAAAVIFKDGSVNDSGDRKWRCCRRVMGLTWCRLRQGL